MELDRRSYGGRGEEPTTTYQIEFPKGGDAGVSSGRVTGKGRDADGDAGAFLAPACPGRRDHLGGGGPPSSNIPTMRHAVPVEFTKWTPKDHSNVQMWGGETEAATGGGGGKRKCGDGLRGLREAASVGP